MTPKKPKGTTNIEPKLDLENLRLLHSSKARQSSFIRTPAVITVDDLALGLSQGNVGFEIKLGLNLVCCFWFFGCHFLIF